MNNNQAKQKIIILSLSTLNILLIYKDSEERKKLGVKGFSTSATPATYNPNLKKEILNLPTTYHWFTKYKHLTPWAWQGINVFF